MELVYITAFTHCGSTWLIRCLQDLNLQIGDSPFNTYQSPFKGCMLSDDAIASGLANSVTDKKTFFRTLWHTVPTYLQAKAAKTIIIIRDPRDAAWSLYHQEHSNKSFAEFNRCFSLGHMWQDYNKNCLMLPNVRFIKFEDFKRYPEEQLKLVLNFCNVDVPDTAIKYAADNNTFEMGKKWEVEKFGVTSHPMMRSGKIAQWREHPEHDALFQMIKNAASPLFEFFNY